MTLILTVRKCSQKGRASGARECQSRVGVAAVSCSSASGLPGPVASFPLGATASESTWEVFFFSLLLFLIEKDRGSFSKRGNED